MLKRNSRTWPARCAPLPIALLFASFANSQTPTLDTEQLAFLALINNYRAQHGAGPLQVSVALQNSSQWMSTDMATKNYFGHTDSLGRDPFTRMNAFGYTYTPAGENIAAGYSDAQSALNQWINACDADSSGNCTYAHRQNMLNASFVVIGIGRAYNASSLYGWYWTTDFGGVVDQTINTNNPPPSATGLGFFPVTPCRMVDTRASQGKTGAFGPPALTAYHGRDFPLLSSGCGVPSTAQAYSLNFTVVPPGPVDFLSAWPAGQVFPNISTLNSPDGSIRANAAIVPAGTNGAITVTAGESTDLVIDVNGYFASPNGQELAFYTMTPCRVVDTRASQGKTGAFGPPALAPYTGRDFPILSSSCNIPGWAEAYSLNMTVVPPGPLDFLSTWPAGHTYPAVSTLNSTRGTTLANAAIVPAGTGGDIMVTAGNSTDLIIDMNGYFGPPGGAGALHYYPVTPCRVADTRASQGKTGAFGPPSLVAYKGRDFPIAGSCGVPSSAKAYALNVTVVPQGPLSFLSIWPSSQTYPGVSTLNSTDGGVLANAAIVPAGTNGAVSVVAGNPTDVIIDVNGYFAP